MALLQIDGTTLEGGGQLVRLAIGLAALVKRPIQINNIRGRRRGAGGLKGQHLTAISWLASMCGAETEGLELQSKRLAFKPDTTPGRFMPHILGSLPNGQPARAITIDLKTPGAITLVLQCLLPFVVFHGWSGGNQQDGHEDSQDCSTISLTFSGGTNVSGSPSIDYVSEVLFPNLRRLGVIDATVAPGYRRGWTTGAMEMGEATFTVTPLPRGQTLNAFQVSQRGDVVKITATLLAPSHIRSELRDGILSQLARTFPDLELVIAVDEDSRNLKRLYLLLVAHTASGLRLGRDWLYDNKITVDAKGWSKAVSSLIRRVVDDLEREIKSGSSLDSYMEDETVVYQALAEGRSSLLPGHDPRSGQPRPPTLHTQTARWICQEVLGVEFKSHGGCRGVGFAVKP